MVDAPRRSVGLLLMVIDKMHSISTHSVVSLFPATSTGWEASRWRIVSRDSSRTSVLLSLLNRAIVEDSSVAELYAGTCLTVYLG
jgi:hypothetical protein